MEISEINKTVESISNLIQYFGWGAVVLVIVLIGILYYYLKHRIPAYLEEKSKNQATKEDIKEITDKIESVKNEYKLIFSQEERKRELKKEVYMESVGAIVQMHGALANISDMDISTKEISSRFVVNEGITAKVQVVGDEETVKLLTIILGDIGVYFLQLLPERHRLLDKKFSLDNIAKYRDYYRDQCQKFIHIMEDMRIRGIQDENSWNSIEGMYKGNMSEQERCINDHQKLNKEYVMELSEFTKKCMDAFFDIAHKFPDLILSVRRELHLDIDEKEFRNILINNADRGIKAFSEFYLS